MGRLGEARLNTTPSVTTHGLSPIVRSTRHRRLRRPRWGTAGHRAEPGRSCLAQTLDGTAGRRPNRGGGLRAAAEATRHNVTKPHRPRTNRDAGRERASGAAGRSTRQAGASTSRRHWLWTRMESRASSGPEEKYDTGAVMRTSDGRSNRRFRHVPQATHINHQL